ncbi:2-keto-4-pentenoate hydratase [Phenylobacterium sp. J367]|uniref:2-keto-4-pentenoate hydratase n=1 Tax=Phenylobacterium sp. J367 TaxID=2898435 RepID=UPI002151030E|nr:hypothetical protein [Phenylobacterium sp. J367]MCR5877221.1 hypothetical protein [Phenylobacterium sp. J367]
MSRVLFPALAAAFGLSACATAGPPPADPYLDAYVAAEAAATPFAPITDTRPDVTLADAYRLQDGLIARRRAAGDRVAGYRGGLMSQASMKGRGVTAPLVGVLFASGRTESGQRFDLCSYRRPIVELKLGFVFGKRLTAAPADLDAIKAAVGEVVPVVDLPDIAYRDPDKYGAADMIAANITAARWVRGKGHAPDLDLDALKVSITHNDQPVAAGVGRDSFDGQWQGLLEVVRQIVAQGRTISPGDVVLTGRMGPRPWLPPGAYLANYGPLGTVAFQVDACPTR